MCQASLLTCPLGFPTILRIKPKPLILTLSTRWSSRYLHLPLLMDPCHPAATHDHRAAPPPRTLAFAVPSAGTPFFALINLQVTPAHCSPCFPSLTFSRKPELTLSTESPFFWRSLKALPSALSQCFLALQPWPP